MLHKKKGQSLRERCNEIKSSLNWSRNRGAVPSFPPQPRGPSCQEDIDNVLTWIRSKKVDSNDPTGGDFKKIDQLLSMKRGQEPEDRACDIEAALDWMCNTGVSPADDDVVDKLNKDGCIPVSRRSPEERSIPVSNTNPNIQQ
jgi:hypothetical protein